jgi:hypothetical protein
MQTISGPAYGVIVSGGGESGVFNVGSGVIATMDGLTIADGLTAYGGGIYNFGTLTVSSSTLSGNTATADGGGIFNSGFLTISSSTLSGNSAIEGAGGGIWSGKNFFVISSTLAGNSAGFGGGIDNAKLFNASGLESIGVGEVLDSTLSGNSASTGGGIDNAGAIVTLVSTIVAENQSTGSGPDVFAEYTDIGNNLIGETDGSSGWDESTLIGTSAQPVDPLLCPLGDYGGPTETMALLPGSPAIGEGTMALHPGTTNPITTDQRGLALDMPTADIGAFQSQGFTLRAVDGSNSKAAAQGGAFANPLAVIVTSNNESDPEPVIGGIVTFAVQQASDGASVTLSSATATIGASGIAHVSATANSTGGSHVVAASAGGGGKFDFVLSNLLQKPTINWAIPARGGQPDAMLTADQETQIRDLLVDGHAIEAEEKPAD